MIVFALQSDRSWASQRADEQVIEIEPESVVVAVVAAEVEQREWRKPARHWLVVQEPESSQRQQRGWVRQTVMAHFADRQAQRHSQRLMESPQQKLRRQLSFALLLEIVVVVEREEESVPSFWPFSFPLAEVSFWPLPLRTAVVVVVEIVQAAIEQKYCCSASSSWRTVVALVVVQVVSVCSSLQPHCRREQVSPALVQGP